LLYVYIEVMQLSSDFAAGIRRRPATGAAAKEHVPMRSREDFARQRKGDDG